MKKPKHIIKLERAVDFLLALACSLGVLILLHQFAGRICGAYFPVTKDVKITRVEPVGDTRSRIWGEMTIIRDCDFIGVDFFLGSLNNSARVDLDIEERAKKRGLGVHSFGPWVVQLDAEQLNGRAFAIATHDCNPFWQTETVFYRSIGG